MSLISREKSYILYKMLSSSLNKISKDNIKNNVLISGSIESVSESNICIVLDNNDTLFIDKNCLYKDTYKDGDRIYITTDYQIFVNKEETEKIKKEMGDLQDELFK